jgi:hypothetical protein
MKRFLIAALFPVAALANECVMMDRTVSATSVKIQERSPIQQYVVPLPNGNSRCIVQFRARVDATWYMAHGEYDWPGDRPRGEACAVAVSRAEDAVQKQVAPSHVRTEKVMVCTDNPDMAAIRNTNPGSVGRQHQFRPHPDFPRRFWHNGAQCRWFLDPGLRNGDIYRYQGIICQLEGDNWVVLDKF